MPTQDAARFTDPILRCNFNNVGFLKPRQVFLDELEKVPALLAPFYFARSELPSVDATDSCAVLITHLGHIRSQFDRVTLRPQDRFLTREAYAALFGLIHQFWQYFPCAPRLFRRSEERR